MCDAVEIHRGSYWESQNATELSNCSPITKYVLNIEPIYTHKYMFTAPQNLGVLTVYFSLI